MFISALWCTVRFYVLSVSFPFYFILNAVLGKVFMVINKGCLSPNPVCWLYGLEGSELEVKYIVIISKVIQLLKTECLL